MKKIWLSMFYSIRVGKEPNSVFLKNREIRTKSRWYGSTPSSCAKGLTISEGTVVTSLFNFHLRVLMCFHTPSRPRKMDKFLFFSYRNTYKIRHYKKDNGNPTINYFIYEFHNNRNTCPTKTEFVTCYPLAEQTKIYLCTI